MSVVSNFVGGISPEQFSEKALNQNKGFNTDDTAFSDLLERQMNSEKTSENNWLNMFGYNPVQGDAGINIEVLSSMMSPVKAISSDYEMNEDVTTSEMLTFLTSPFDLKNSLNFNNHGFMNFAQKQAAGFYNKCASNVITNLSEFVEDTLKIS